MSVRKVRVASSPSAPGIPWGPWFEQSAEIADLIEWLRFRQVFEMDDVLYLLRKPWKYDREYVEMRAAGGPEA